MPPWQYGSPEVYESVPYEKEYSHTPAPPSKNVLMMLIDYTQGARGKISEGCRESTQAVTAKLVLPRAKEAACNLVQVTLTSLLNVFLQVGLPCK